jgi:two-component sensor histidine kinase
MLTGEMNHRIKNLFTIAAALTAIASRSTTTKEEMVQDLTRRLTALSAAHDLARVDLGGAGKAALIGDLLSALLKPYADDSSGADRVRVTAPDLRVGESSATALALIVHELATNSLKYGALSSNTGLLEVSCGDQTDDVVLVWKETGGPPIAVSAKPSGFGSQLITRSVTGQLGGSIEVEWPSEGALVKLRVSKARLAV